MRSFSLLTLLFVIFATPAYSFEHQFSLGGGFNVNTNTTESDLGSGVDEEISTSLVIAGKEEIKINEEWLFRTGLWLQDKSAKYSVDFGLLEGEVTAHTIYLSVPITAQYQANKDIAIFGGYIADVRINDYCDADGDFNNCNIEEDSQSLVHVATLGVSITGSEKWDVDLSWQQGLSDVYEDEIKIHTFQAMAFYKF